MGNSHWKCSVLPVCPISLFGSLFPVGRYRVSLGEVTCTQMKHENTDKSTQPCPVKHILIGKCWDVHSTIAERERGADKPNGGQLNKWMSRGGGDVQKRLWVPSKNLRLTFPVCVRHESAQCSGHGRFVCQWCFSFWFPMVTGISYSYICYSIFYPDNFWMFAVFMCCAKGMSASGGKG